PMLEALEVSLAAGQATPASLASYQVNKKQLEDRKLEINTRRNADNQFNNMAVNGIITANGGGGAVAQAQQADLDKGLNEVARDMQVLEFQAKDVQRRDGKFA